MPTLRHERRKATNIDHELGYLASDELALLSEAKRWNRLLVDETLDGIDADRISNVVEVGCGHGAILAALRSRFPDARIVGLEPDTANFEVASDTHAADDRMDVLNITLADYLAEHELTRLHDLVVFINVLEHIEDDGEELAAGGARVRPGGWVGILVPALPALYGPIDLKSGHFRRYSEEQLTDLISRRGSASDPCSSHRRTRRHSVLDQLPLAEQVRHFRRWGVGVRERVRAGHPLRHPARQEPPARQESRRPRLSTRPTVC